jgi:hypothetical protein
MGAFREGNQPDRESCRNESPRRADQEGRNLKEQEGTGRSKSDSSLKPVSLVDSRRGRGVTRIDRNVDKETKERLQR